MYIVQSQMNSSITTLFAYLFADGEEIDCFVEMAMLEEEGGAFGDERGIRGSVQVVGDQLQRTELLRLKRQI